MYRFVPSKCTYFRIFRSPRAVGSANRKLSTNVELLVLILTSGQNYVFINKPFVLYFTPIFCKPNLIRLTGITCVSPKSILSLFSSTKPYCTW